MREESTQKSFERTPHIVDAALLERALDALIAREAKRRFAVKADGTPVSTGVAGAGDAKSSGELAPERVVGADGPRRWVAGPKRIA